MIAVLMALMVTAFAAAGAGADSEGGAGFPRPVKAPTPASDPGGWVTPGDYPKTALNGGVQGVTGFRLDVDSSGRVDDCSITQSSGSLDLDQATCQLIMERARFTPALDIQGHPTPGHYVSRVKWMIPLKPAPRSGFLRSSYVVHSDGRVSDCQLQAEGGFEGLPRPLSSGACPPALAFLDGYTDDQGRPVERRVVTTTRIEVLPLEAKSPPQAAPSPDRKPVTGRAP